MKIQILKNILPKLLFVISFFLFSLNIFAQNLNTNHKIKIDDIVYKQESYNFDLNTQKQKFSQLAMTKIWVFDENANLLFEDDAIWNTGFGETLHFNIPANTLDEGNYRIIAKTRYENGIEETVAEKNIKVLSNGQTWFTQNKIFFWPAFFIIVAAAFLHHVFVELELYRKIKSLKKNLKKNKAKKTLKIKAKTKKKISRKV